MAEVLYYTIKIDGIDNETKQLGELEKKIKDLTYVLNLMKASTDTDTEALGRQKAALALATKERNEYLAAIKKTATETKAETGSMIEMEAALSKANLAYRSLSKTDRESKVGQDLKKNIVELTKELSKLEQETGRFQRQVGNYNTAGVAMSQVLREIPAFTYSAQTGILALSNNIPILVDEMRNIAEAMDGVTGKKKGWAAALLEMGKNLFSLGGVMTIALGLFTIFSDKIITMITGTKKLSEEEEKAIALKKDHIVAIHEIDNAFKVWNGTMTETEAALDNVAFKNSEVLKQIHKDTQKQLDENLTTWSMFKADLEAMFLNIYSPVGSKLTGGSILADNQAKLEKKDRDKQRMFLYNEQIDFNLKLKDLAMKSEDELEEIRARAIGNELDSQIALLAIEERREKTAANALMSNATLTGKGKEVNDALINKRFLQIEEKYRIKEQLLIDKYNKAKAEKEKKAAEELAQKLAEIDAKKLELKRQYNNELIDLIPDQFKRERDKETYRHYNLLEDYEAAQKKYPERKAEYNNLIESEEKTHAKNMEDILIDAVLRQSKISEDEKKIQLKQKEEYDKAVRQMVIDQIEDDEKLEEKRNKDRIDTAKVLYQYLLQAEQQFFRMKEEAIARSLKREEAMIEASAETQQNILKNRLDKGIISEAQYNADKNELDRQTQEKKLEAQKAAFEKEKKLALAQIAVNTAIAISNVWATKGLAVPVAIAQTAGIVAINALQAAAVNAQEFATGGLVKDKDRNIVPKANGDSVLATLTPGEVVLNERQQQMLGGASTFAKIGVPGFTPMPNSASGGSVSSISKKEFQAMFSGLGKMINSKKVYQLESENKRVRESVQSYESNSKW